MTFHVEPVVGLWFLANALALIYTVNALVDSLRYLRLARVDTEIRHEVREITAFSNARREFLRIVQLSLLLSLVVPAVLSPRPIVLSPAILALIAVLLVLLTSTLLDARDRRRLSDLLLGLVAAERTQVAQEASVQHGIELVQQNLELTKDVGAKAAGAFDVANHSNQKLVELGGQIVDLKTELLRQTGLLAGKEDKP